ncbi:MAG: hypothetical protein ACK587_14455 [Cyanobacteriota bacterium]
MGQPGIEAQPIKVWAGHQLLDFNDVVDVLLIAGAVVDLPAEPYNLDSSEVILLLDFVRLMRLLYGFGEVPLTPFPEERKKLDIGDYYPTHAHCQQTTGGLPKRPLRQTLRRKQEYYGA